MADDVPATPESMASKGGKARAARMTKQERSDASRKAADARWAVRPLKATHAGEIDIAGHKIACAVLDDGRRVLAQQSVMSAIGIRGRPRRAERLVETEGCFVPPSFLDADNLKPFISKELQAASSTVVYRTLNGQRAFGYEARLLPMVCEVYLAARKAGVLTAHQAHIAEGCELLVRGLARVGIVALVDEVTRYQEVRDRQALQAILECFLRHELAAWAKRFPDEFYREMFRLRGWVWNGMNPAGGPRCVAQFTDDLVYRRVAPGILDELRSRNPVMPNGRRKGAHHQLLTDEIGHPALAQHLHAVIGLMRASTDWAGFVRLIDRAFPCRGRSVQLDFDDLSQTPGGATPVGGLVQTPEF